MTDKIIIHEQERDQLEILIGKLHEANAEVIKLVSEAADTNFSAEMDVMSADLQQMIDHTRVINNQAELMAYQEYRNRFLK
ncbi:hypothetical protein [Leuconostoc inhae]|uniref:hypothetical protein n=1 Tax=Leuconostoc inhae TaxID=178001 RepID=UPI001C7D80C5|nr:hypothetical protein [Leuconostoc inhae]